MLTLEMNDFWWNDHPCFEIHGCYCRARPGAELWYEWAWEPQLIVAWAYELVRRLPETKARVEPQIIAELREMPRYDLLDLRTREILIWASPPELRPRPRVVANPENVGVFEVGYINLPLFDMERGSRKDLIAIYEKHVVRKAAAKGKGGSPRNASQLKRVANWRHVESLSQGGGPGTKRTRDHSIDRGKYHRPWGLKGWITSRLAKKKKIFTPFPFRKVLSFINEDFTQKEVLESTKG
jgi:hypothetical protein